MSKNNLLSESVLPRKHIVLLEASNFLFFVDNTNERIVQEALNRAKEGRTTIVVAHRLSTIRNADLILTMKANSDIVEAGTHNQLLLKKGYYFELVQAQKKESDSNTDDEGMSIDDESVDESCEYFNHACKNVKGS